MKKIVGSIVFGATTIGGIFTYEKISKNLNFKNNIFLNYKDAEKFKTKQHSFPDSVKRTVCIVGAGVVGIATAYHLLAEGCNVILIERNSLPAMETSF